MSHLHKITLTTSAVLLFSLTASAQVLSPPTFTKGFNQGLTLTPQLTIAPDGTTTATLRFIITNTNLTTLNGIAFTDTLPAGLIVANPTGKLGSCGGVVTATAGSNTISLTNATLGASGSGGGFCSFVVNVVSPVGTAPGLLTNTTGTLTATGLANGGTATASVAVLAPPSLTKAFTAPFVGVGGATTLTLTLNNINATALTGVAFTDTLPAGLGFPVATPIFLTSTCGGLVDANVGPPSVLSLDGGTIPANASCTITFRVVGTVPGLVTNTTSTIIATGTAAGAVATAVLPVIPADVFQVRYASNLAIGDSVIDFTNTGASSTIALPVQNGNICVNAYVFSPDEQLISCCSCPVTPDGLQSLSARNDLISNTLTPGVPTSVVVKLLASAQATCNASTVTPASLALAAGLAAWGTTIHTTPVTAGTPAGTFGLTETPFTRSTLSPAELLRLTTLCSFNQINGSGFGVCRSCRLGGLGAERQ